MFDPKSHYERMLFKSETTYKADLQSGNIKPKKETIYHEKPNCLHVPPPPLKFLHTLSDWRVPNIPINLFVKPKETVHTDPSQIQEPYGHPVDLEREQVQRTRPRVFMVPAISMDDIKDPHFRQILVEDVYTTTAMKVMRAQDVENHRSFKAPLANILVKPNPIKLPRFEMPYVSPEWRMDSVTWDNTQLRAYTDYTKDFWLNRTSHVNF